MNGFLEKIIFVTFIAVFIVDSVTADDDQRPIESPDTSDDSQANNDSSDKSQSFELRAGLVAWLSSQVNDDATDIEANLKINRSLETKTCPEKIIFSYVESNKRLILAECKTVWRRFVKQPNWLSPKKIAPKITHQDRAALVDVFILDRNIEKGEPLKQKDLIRKKLRAVDFSPFHLELNENIPLKASKDLIAGKPLAQSDILVGKRVLTASSAIPSGSGLSDTLTKIEIRYQNIPSDALIESTGWAFMETNRTIMAGEIIRERYLRKAKLVRRKDPVTLVNNNRAIQIITSGTAMQDGYYGQSVKVINTESGRSVMGTVTGRGRVEINTGQ